MIQLATSGDAIVRDVVERITAVLRPWRIVLFGSRARGGAGRHSDYDFYIEVEAPDDEELKAIHLRIFGMFSGTSPSKDFKVVRRGSLERRRHDPGTMEWDVAREGKLLYADPEATTDIAPQERVREPSPEVPESVSEWLDIAERDLRHRDDLWKLGRDYWSEICWLSHQTIEKHMKALLVSRWVRPARTHVLEELLEALRNAGVEMPAVDDDCKLLTTHAIAPRYGAALTLGQGDARIATDAADRVLAAVRRHLPALRQT